MTSPSFEFAGPPPAKLRRKDIRVKSTIGLSLHSTDPIVFEDSQSCSTLGDTSDNDQRLSNPKISMRGRKPRSEYGKEKLSKEDNIDDSWFTLSTASISELSSLQSKKKGNNSYLRSIQAPKVVTVKESVQREEPPKADLHRPSSNRLPVVALVAQWDSIAKQNQSAGVMSKTEREARDREEALIRKMKRAESPSKKLSIPEKPTQVLATDTEQPHKKTIQRISKPPASNIRRRDDDTDDDRGYPIPKSMTRKEIQARKMAEMLMEKMARQTRTSPRAAASVGGSQRDDISEISKSPKPEHESDRASPKIPFVSPSVSDREIESENDRASPEIPFASPLASERETDFASERESPDIPFVSPSASDREIESESDRESPKIPFGSPLARYRTPSFAGTPTSGREVDFASDRESPEIPFASDREESESQDYSELIDREAMNGLHERSLLGEEEEGIEVIPKEIMIHDEDNDYFTTTPKQANISSSTKRKSQHRNERNGVEIHLGDYFVELKGPDVTPVCSARTIKSTDNERGNRIESRMLAKTDVAPVLPARQCSPRIPSPPLVIPQDLESGTASDASDHGENTNIYDSAIKRSARLAKEVKREGKTIQKRMIAICIILLVAFSLILFVVLDPLQRRIQR